MSAQAPPIRNVEFDELYTDDPAEVRRRFDPLVPQLHAYLNELPCLRNLYIMRRRWRPGAHSGDAFRRFVTSRKHWYTFHYGGRNEAQFNVGMWPEYLRIGLGFELSEG